MTAKATKLPSLEASLTEISQLVDTMENGDLTLEQSMTRFERGIMLIKHCQKILTEAEHKVQILVQKNGQESLNTYGDHNEGSDNDDNTADK